MTDSQLTQCPHCKASFKVSQEQLSVANGKVRCGACLNVFDAITYKISAATKQDSSSSAAQSHQSIHDEDFSFDLDDAIDLEDELTEKLHSKQPISSKSTSKTADKNNSFDEDDTFFADDPEEDKLDTGYAGSTQFGDELSSSFLDLDKSSKDSYKSQFQNEELTDLVETEAIDESWTSSILDDLETPETVKDKSEPSLNANDAVDDDLNEPTLDDLSQTASHSSDAFHLDQKDLNALNFEYEQDTQPKKKWLIGGILFLFNIALLVLLLAQASWFHYEKLVKYPKVAQAYEFICTKIGCELPALSDISKIESQNLVVRSHPTTFNALIIDTIITNKASFEQDFPDISLTFSNINNQVVAQRLISPAEYLNDELLSWSGMPPEQAIQITLEIIDPGAEAVNYKLNFHPSKGSNIDQEADQLSTNQSKK